MRTSPVQLVELVFRCVHVEADGEHMRLETRSASDPHRMFEGVVINTEVSQNRLEYDDPRGTPFFVTLRVVVDNRPVESAQFQTFSPYKIDVEAGGVVVIAPGAERLGDPEDLAAVNGTALLWGAIREQVANLSSRMTAGAAMLPSVNFLDLKKVRHGGGEVREPAPEPQLQTPPAEPPAPPRRARTRKS